MMLSNRGFGAGKRLRKDRLDVPSAGTGKMLITRQARSGLTSTWFRNYRVTCGGWFGAPIVN